jgi:hypothetical protein
MLDWLSKEFLIAIIVSLAISLIALSWFGPPYPNQGPPRQQAGEQSKANQNSASSESILQIECNPNCTATRFNKVQNYDTFARFVNYASDDPVVALTGGILVANFLLVLTVILQIRDGRKSSERQLRAYIMSVVGVGFRQGGTRGLRFEFRPILLNTGQTPAYDAHIINGIRLLSPQEAESYDFRLQNMPGSVATLGPRQDRFTQAIFERRLSKAELREYRLGVRKLYVFGTITYRDAFRKHRYTNFCYSIAWWPKRAGAIWHTENRHNDCN